MPELSYYVQAEHGRVVLQVDDPVDPATVVVERSPIGEPVRPSMVLERADMWVAYDYEVDINTPTAYRLPGGAYGPEVTLTTDSGWWKPLPFPTLSMRPHVVDGFGQRTSAQHSSWHHPLSSGYPIVHAGARLSWAGSLTFATLTADEGSRFWSGLSKSPIALWQPPDEKSMYLAVGGVTRTKATRLLSDPALLWTVDVQEVLKPPAEWEFSGAASWQQHMDEGDTWADWASGTWMDVLTG